MATLNKVSKLKGNFLLQVMKGHLNVATFNEKTCKPLEKVILKNGSFLSTDVLCPVMITKLRKQLYKRFIIPTESSTNQENQGVNLSLSQFSILLNFNQRAPPSMKSADPCPSSTPLMAVNQSTNVRETAL